MSSGGKPPDPDPARAKEKRNLLRGWGLNEVKGF